MDFGEKTILMILWSEFTTVVHSYCGSQFCVFAYVSDTKFISAMQPSFSGTRQNLHIWYHRFYCENADWPETLLQNQL